MGTTANAVLVQIWTARIAMLLVRWLRMRSTFGWSLSNLVALLRQQLFVYRDLMTWLNHPFESPPELYAAEQLALEWTSVWTAAHPKKVTLYYAGINGVILWKRGLSGYFGALFLHDGNARTVTQNTPSSHWKDMRSFTSGQQIGRP